MFFVLTISTVLCMPPQSKIFFDIVSSLSFCFLYIISLILIWCTKGSSSPDLHLPFDINHPRTIQALKYFPHVGCFAWWIEHPLLLFSIVTMSGRWPASIPSQAYPRKTTASLSSTNSKSLFFAVRTPLQSIFGALQCAAAMANV